MGIKSFRDLYHHQLRRIYGTAFNSALLLPHLRRAASSPELISALEDDEARAKDQGERLSELLPSSPHHASVPMSVTSLLRNCLMLGKYEELSHDGRDAALVDLVRRLRHDQIAGLSSARTWARAMQDYAAVSILEDCLREEKYSDERLEAIGDQCCRRAISCCARCVKENFCATEAHA